LPGAPSIVVPDIHGCSHFLEWVEARFPDRSLILLGDLLHRGPDSRAALRIALGWAESGRATLLWGNHEHWVCTEGLNLTGRARTAWFREHEAEVVAQYEAAGDDLNAFITDLERFRALARPYVVEGPMLCAHAARPRLGAHADDLLDTGYLWDTPDLGLHPLPTHLHPGLTYSVHGHKPQREPVVDLHGEGVVYLDLGSASTGRFGVWDAQSRSIHLYDES